MTTKTITPTPATTETYAAAYAKLAAIASKLSAAGATANVDDLVHDLRLARSAYATCKARLDAIRAEVDAELEAAGDTVAEA